MARIADVTNKVIVLYILSCVEGLTLPQLNDRAVGTAYMDYFQFMQAFESLRDDGCVVLSVRKDESEQDSHGRAVERCSLTPRGAEALRTLAQGIPRHVADYLAGETARWSRAERDGRAAEASWQPDAAGGYRVDLRMGDGIGTLLELSLRLPSKSEAAALCERFRSDPGAFHLGLMRFCTLPGRRADTDPESDDMSPATGPAAD